MNLYTTTTAQQDRAVLKKFIYPKTACVANFIPKNDHGEITILFNFEGKTYLISPRGKITELETE